VLSFLAGEVFAEVRRRIVLAPTAANAFPCLGWGTRHNLSLFRVIDLGAGRA
jgi:hypothetical protein